MSILECRALTKNYGAKTGLDSVDLTIEPGRIVGLLGPNGSGKTTKYGDCLRHSLLSRFWLVHLPSFLERLLLTAVRCYGKTVIRTICEIMLLI